MTNLEDFKKFVSYVGIWSIDFLLQVIKYAHGITHILEIYLGYEFIKFGQNFMRLK
jgi:hypothetical protein